MPRVNVKDKRKQQLMEANIASIARRGLEDTTIAHVSKGAEMSRGIVNFYFTSKEKMMQETLASLAEECTQVWQEALALKRRNTNDPIALIDSLVHTLMSDKLCSAKRMAVWSAFIGYAGTHSEYAKIIRTMDDAIAKQLGDLWLRVNPDAKLASQRTHQTQALIRGHWLMSALGSDDNRPSSYSDAWMALLQGTGSKIVKLKAEEKPKKPHAPHVLPGQLDFADLLSKG